MLLSSKSLRKTRISTKNWRQYDEFDNHEFLIALSDKNSGLKAFVAIHNRNLGLAHGGTRVQYYQDETEALQDVLSLSKAMSYKSALAGLPFGGAKGVILLDETTDRNAVLKAYAQRVNALNGLFRTGVDVGLTDADVRFMSKYSQYMLGVSIKDAHGFSTSKAAAQGVYGAIKAAVQYKYGTDLKGKTIGIKGVGKLGEALVELLARDQADLVIADINGQKAHDIQRKYQGVRIARADEIHKYPMHVYAPCALGNEFTPRTVPVLNCEVIAGGANNQLASDEVGDELFARGILYAPDYIANAGGLIFVTEELEKGGFRLERLTHRLNNIGRTLTNVFKGSEAEHVPTHRFASRLAQTRIWGRGT